MKRKALLFCLCLMCIVPSAYAQRTGNRQFFLDASARMVFPEMMFGGRLGTGQYLFYTYWRAGFQFQMDRMSLSNGHQLEFTDYLADGGFFWRALSTRTRDFNFYLGGVGFLGMEQYDPFNRIDPTEKTLPDGIVLTGQRFVGGVAPALEFEWFFYDRFALLVSGDLSFCFNSRLVLLRPAVYAGIRIGL